MNEDFNEIEALETLLVSDGWKAFSDYIDQEWGATAYARKIDQALVAAKQNRDSAEGDICELGAAARAVRLAFNWPVQRLLTLKAEKDKPAKGFGLRRRA